MKRLFLFVLSLAFASFLGSCNNHNKTNAITEFDNNKVDINEMRASEKNNTLAGNSKVAVIDLQEHEAITSYTELVQGKLNTIVEMEKAAEVRLSVIDGNGKMLKTFTQASRAGRNEYQLDFNEMSLGQYYVVVLSDDTYRRFCVAKTN